MARALVVDAVAVAAVGCSMAWLITESMPQMKMQATAAD
jgi:hypothetical protein